MIRPETLLQSSNALDQDFSAPVRLQAQELHCGLGLNGYYWEPACVQRFATYRVFVLVLATLSFLQGAAMGYFSATAGAVARSYGFSEDLVSWILVTNEIAQALMALFVCHLGGKLNRPGLIATCITLQALTCFLLMLPHVVHGSDPTPHNSVNATVQDLSDKQLCYKELPTPKALEDDNCVFAVVLMFLLQLGAGLGGIAVLAHGVVYIDDNVDPGNSAALIGEVIALRHLGPHTGLLMAWRFLSIYSGPLDVEPSKNSAEWIGAWWIGWPILSSLLFVAAVVVAMFPKQLPSQAVKEMAASIVDLARGVTVREPVDPKLTNKGFLWSLRRLLTNRIIILNTLATVCLQTAMVNYLAMEDEYLESKFYVPRPRDQAGGFQDPWTSRLIIGLLGPPLVALHILVQGQVISRLHMRASRLTAWHTFIALSVAIFMFSRIFTNCPSLHVEGEKAGRLDPLQTCNRDCDCLKSEDFNPVCSQTGSFLFYSPCYAGCQHVKSVDDIQIYSNCSCVQKKLGDVKLHEAKEGPCKNADCNTSWILNQVFTVLTAAMVGVRLVGNTILTFRSVQPMDKSLAVGLELTLVGLITYVPGKLLYELMADSTCMYRRGSDQCKLHNADQFGLYINLTSGCLMLLCAGLSAAVWYYARDLDLYVGDDDELMELKDLHRKRDSKVSSRVATPAVTRRKDNAHRSAESVATVDLATVPADDEFRFDLADLSDHMEDSLDGHHSTRPTSIF